MRNQTLDLDLCHALGWKKWDGVYLGGTDYNKVRWIYIDPEGKQWNSEALKGKLPTFFPSFTTCRDLVHEEIDKLSDSQLEKFHLRLMDCDAWPFWRASAEQLAKILLEILKEASE